MAVLTSTTDSEAEVKAAFEGKPAEVAPPAEETPEQKAAREAAAAGEQTEEERAAGKESPTTEEQKKKTQGRISKLTAKLHQVEQENADLRRRVEEKQPGKPAAEAEAERAAAAPKPKPIRANFKSDEEFIDALTDWKLEERERNRTAAELTAEENERLKQVFDAYNEQLVEAKVAHEDFVEVVGQTKPLWKGVILAVRELANGAEVAYHLGKNPAVVDRLMGMSELAAIAELGVIAKEVGGKTAPAKTVATTGGTERKTSAAPAPIRTVGGGSARSSVPLDKLSFQDYKRARAQGRTN